MWRTVLPSILLLLLTKPAMAKVYQCVTDGSVTFSSIPCDDQSSVLSAGQQAEPGVIEKFTMPEYPDWQRGWRQTVDFKLSSFAEAEYVPVRLQGKARPALVSQQKLSNVAPSFSVQDMAVSVKDTIESLCKESRLDSADIHNPSPNNVFYGQYSCSARRDTQNGELGVYKIMRGENSIYVVSVKWELTPFTLYPGKKPQVLENKELKNRLQTAKNYLMEDVRLCRNILCY
ncbi:DUF4124 domain-containing protein [Psychromonas sp.]|uniref:DUF4124 domain-containing protein n=1 Tax=Psychromonas sp. TaxID=1884585 RepID=UPI0035643327